MNLLIRVTAAIVVAVLFFPVAVLRGYQRVRAAKLRRTVYGTN
jgi:hypothetical protein